MELISEPEVWTDCDPDSGGRYAKCLVEPLIEEATWIISQHAPSFRLTSALHQRGALFTSSKRNVLSSRLVMMNDHFMQFPSSPDLRQNWGGGPALGSRKIEARQGLV